MKASGSSRSYFFSGKFQLKCFLINDDVDNAFEIREGFLVVFDHLGLSFIYPGGGIRKELIMVQLCVRLSLAPILQLDLCRGTSPNAA